MFNAALRNRMAVKHAHSPMEPERDWGTDPLNSIRYVLYALNQEHAATGEREFELPILLKQQRSRNRAQSSRGSRFEQGRQTTQGRRPPLASIAHPRRSAGGRNPRKPRVSPCRSASCNGQLAQARASRNLTL